MPSVPCVVRSRTKLIRMRGENCVDASVSVISRIANTIDTTVMIEVAMLLRITWATPGSSCEGKSVLGIQALIPGIASSSDESTAPDAPRIMAMTNGRMRNPPRTAYIAERNRTGKRAIIRMPNEFNQYRSICSGRLPRPPLQPSSGLASRGRPASIANFLYRSAVFRSSAESGRMLQPTSVLVHQRRFSLPQRTSASRPMRSL
jgi:hypothetical protein